MPELPPYSNLTTSKEAAESIVDSYPKTQSRVLRTISNHPVGRTCDEVEELTGLSHQSVSSAIRSLTKAGVLFDSRHRKPTRTGRNAIIWKVTTP